MESPETIGTLLWARLSKRGRVIALAVVAAPVVAMLLLATACTSAEDSVAPVTEIFIEGVEILVSEDSAELQLPYDLALDETGNIYVLDRRAGQIVVVAPDGEVQRQVGRRGQGPGEFGLPVAVRVDGERIRIADPRNAAVHVLDLDGTPVDRHPFVATGFPTALAIGPACSLAYASPAVPSLGGVILVADVCTEEAEVLGDLPAPEAVRPGFEAVRQAALDGQVHEYLRNAARPAFAPDGSLWLFIQTESTLRHYGADGALLSAETFDLPSETARIREQFFELWQNAPAADMYFPLSLAADIQVDEDLVWVLWNTPAEYAGLVTVHNLQGRMRARLVLPGAAVLPAGFFVFQRQMVIDRQRGRIYLTDTSTSSLRAFELPELWR